jgi:hypothetical protein
LLRGRFLLGLASNENRHDSNQTLPAPVQAFICGNSGRLQTVIRFGLLETMVKSLGPSLATLGLGITENLVIHAGHVNAGRIVHFVRSFGKIRSGICYGIRQFCLFIARESALGQGIKPEW